MLLPEGYCIREYEIRGTLGTCDLSVTYLAHDTSLGRAVTLEEFFPRDCAVRAEDRGVRARSHEVAKAYARGLQRFLKEARMLARLNHPSIVAVHAYVEAHGTGYIVRDYIQGETLDQRLIREAEQGRPSAQWHLGEVYSTGRRVAQDDVEALRWLRRAAEQEHILAQTHLWGRYSRGWGVEQDDAEAARWCRLAANQEYAPAQCALGVMYEKGRGVEQNDTEAVKWYRRAADQGNGRARFCLGVMFLEGRGIGDASDYDHEEDVPTTHHDGNQNQEEAVKWFLLAAESGVTSAKWYMGDVEDSPARGNFDKALMWRREAALDGDPAAQYTLGVKYDAGIWGCAGEKFTIEDPSYFSAGDWFRMAAENAMLRRLPVRSSDSAWLFDAIDVMYAEGRWHQEDDDAYGLQSYWMAKERGSSLVQYGLGTMYEDGNHGFGQDDAKAVKWYRRAAEQGNADAQFALGAMYETERGLERERLLTALWEAAAWYRKAADQGNRDAQLALGHMYEAGRGMGQDIALAAVWYLKAADNADEQEWIRWEKLPGKEPLGKCPVCGGGHVFEGSLHYRCEVSTSWDRKCRFKTGKVVLGQPLGRQQMARLLAEGSTELLKDFALPRSSRPFTARLVLDGDGNVTFRFPPKQP